MTRYRMFENLIPYTDTHEMNLDWIIQQVEKGNIKIEELEDIVNNKIDVYVQQYIADNLSQFILGAIYNEENTSIKLQQAVVIGDSDHVYNNEQIIVLEGR